MGWVDVMLAIVADHEGNPELGRVLPAVAVALALLIGGQVLGWGARRLSDTTTVRWLTWGSMLLVGVGAVAGSIQRSTSNDTVQCGPVLARTDDSVRCDDVMGRFELITWGGLGLALAALLAAYVVAVVIDRRPPS